MTTSPGRRISFSERSPRVVDAAALATGSPAARNTGGYVIAPAPDSCSPVLTFTAGGDDMPHRGSDHGMTRCGAGFQHHAEGSLR
jgi:hypothetical protein